MARLADQFALEAMDQSGYEAYSLSQKRGVIHCLQAFTCRASLVSDSDRTQYTHIQVTPLSQDGPSRFLYPIDLDSSRCKSRRNASVTRTRHLTKIAGPADFFELGTKVAFFGPMPI